MESNSRPLITFVVFAFNQEKFVGEAIQGAFSQTYSPLEIVLSDDGSKDNTFGVMTRLCQEYRGPHLIKLNRNAQQLGIGGHLDKVMEISRGELIVLSAGDDISLPERSETIFHAWDECGRKATSIYSDYTSISESGEVIQEGREPFNGAEPVTFEAEKVELKTFVRSVKPCVYGCAHAIVRRLYSVFGSLSGQVTYEDMALSFRSHAIGCLLHLKRPLVLYRRHGRNLSFHTLDAGAVDGRSFTILEEKQRARLHGWIRGYQRFGQDLKTLLDRKCISSDDAKDVECEIAKCRTHLELELALMDGSLAQRVRALGGLARSGGSLGQLAAAAPRCLPRVIYKRLRLMKNRLFEKGRTD